MLILVNGMSTRTGITVLYATMNVLLDAGELKTVVHVLMKSVWNVVVSIIMDPVLSVWKEQN